MLTDVIVFLKPRIGLGLKQKLEELLGSHEY